MTNGMKKDKFESRRLKLSADEDSAFTLHEHDDGVAHLVLDMPGARVNILAGPVMRQLDTIIDELSGRPDLKALLVRSGKEENFIAGADVSEIQGITDPAEGTEKARMGQRIFQKINQLPFPVVAVIHGACVGGGLELALACHYRVATAHPKTRIGLPEVKLGILPGFGGSQRLPRLIGIRSALGLILTGKLISSQSALKLGVIDKVLSSDYPAEFVGAAGEEFLFDQIAALGNRPGFRGRHRKFLLTYWVEKIPFFRKMIFQKARQRVQNQTRGHYPAPLKALDAVEQGMAVSLAEGFEIEARLLGELIVTDVCKNLISVYHLNEAVKKDAGVDKAKTVPVEINQVGLLGAGVMGGGIAQLLADHEIGVRMKDISQAAVNLGLQRANEIFKDTVRRKRLTQQEANRRMSRISGTTDYSGFGNSVFVLEAIVEDLDIKKKVLAEVEKHVADTTIIASNTSALSITEIALGLQKPQRAVGFHFFNPVHRMPLVEIIRGDKTSDLTTVTTVAFAKRLRKIPIVVKNSPGFLVNRILGPYINEAVILLSEGRRTESIDRAMLEFGMPMGPLNLIDEVGIDVAFKVAQILHAAFPGRLKPSPIIQKMQEEGRLGKKCGRGFYVYDGKNKRVDEGVFAILGDLAAKENRGGDDDIQDRLYFIMLQEAAFCLEEGIVRQPRDVDAGMIFGTGFPPFRGGVLRYADNLTLPHCVERMQQLAEKYGERFEPARILATKARKNTGFYLS
jgi:3-hydroxyacyl-CoA dehydrogenase/enoyl-CoA hydratase/3-hydroxybutyryl-CoA epimerase